MNPRPTKATLPRWLHLMYTTSWGLFICTLFMPFVVAHDVVADSFPERVGIGLVVFAGFAGGATALHVIAERITKRGYGVGIGGFIYRL